MLAIVDLDWHLYGKYEFVPKISPSVRIRTQVITISTNSYPMHRVSTDSYPNRQYNSYPIHHDQYEFVPETSWSVRIGTQDFTIGTNSYPKVVLKFEPSQCGDGNGSLKSNSEERWVRIRTERAVIC